MSIQWKSYMIVVNVMAPGRFVDGRFVEFSKTDVSSTDVSSNGRFVKAYSLFKNVMAVSSNEKNEKHEKLLSFFVSFFYLIYFN